MTNDLLNLLQEKTQLPSKVIENIINLLNEGCTIPFIARYRKDLTNNASDEALRAFEEVFTYSQKLLKRKEEITNLLDEKNFLNDKVKNSINEAKTLQALEDIYAPFKDKKSSRTSSAIENGLEPLANIIQCLKYTNQEVEQKAKQFVNKNIKSTDDAITGAKDIIAQRYADDFKSKEILRNM
ncbi:MAG: Tex-like N-terminal domain-containing protein, partial [Halarcobacter sp.]